MTSRMTSPVPRTRFLWIAAALPLLGGCARPSGGGDAADSTKPVVAVQTALVVSLPFRPTVSAIGTVVPRAGHVALLSAPGPSRVARIGVVLGQHVTAGMALIELDSVPFQTAVQGANAALTAAQSAYDRAQRLADQGIGTRRDAEQAAADLAKARVDALTARRAEELSVLRSPIPGVVTQLTASLGASVDANEPLVQVADPTTLDVLLTVTPEQAGHIAPGAMVALRAGQNRDGESLGTARVEDVSGTIDSVSRGVSVRLEAPTTGRVLRIGETVFGEIPLAAVGRATMVPNTALVPEGDAFKVFVVDPSGVAHERGVKVGTTVDSMTQILSGLAVGERIVTYGAYGVEDSATVATKSGAPPAGAPEATKKAEARGAPAGAKDSTAKQRPPARMDRP